MADYVMPAFVFIADPSTHVQEVVRVVYDAVVVIVTG